MNHLTNVCLFTVIFLKFIQCAPVDDTSVLEYGPGYNTYGHQQMKVAQMRGIKPLVDTIREEEKYGNDGGKIRNAANTFIRISESASGSLSPALGTPNENTFNIIKPFYPLLMDIGTRLGGLKKR